MIESAPPVEQGPSRAPSDQDEPLRGPLISTPAAVVPFVVAAIALALGAYHDSLGKALLAGFVGAVLIVLAAIDIEHRIIPTLIVLPAAAITLIWRVALTPDRWREYAIGAVLASLLLLAPRLVRRDAVSTGDAQVAALVGAALGWGAAGALAIGFLLIFPVAVATLVRRGFSARSAEIPLTPFLAVGTLLVLLGPKLAGH